MKILQINAVYGISSTGRTTQELHEALIEKGYQSIVATSVSNRESERIFLIGKQWEKKVHGLFSRLFGLQGYYSIRATKKLLKWLQIEKPDIIHLRNLHANYINLNLLFRYIANKKIPTVITLHDCWFFTGKCTHYTIQKCWKWQTGCYKCPKLKSDHNSWFFDRTPKMWKDKALAFQTMKNLAVVGVSNWITNEARKSPMFKNAKLDTIYNWIDLNVFYPRKGNIKKRYNISQEKFTILCISAGWDKTSSKYKDLISLSRKLPDDMQIAVLGEIDKTSIETSNLVFLGYVSDTNELAKIYSAADVYVHLSREDTFGKVIAEAMACGTPVIVYNSTACPELVGEGCGAVIDDFNVDVIVKQLQILAKQDKQIICKKCVEHVRKNFDKETLINRYEQMYQDMVCGTEAE